ncbi:MAG: 2-dehydropantoate 2-reductase N-terminal domain-containing protein, partial [Acutalibacter sp.]
MTIQQEHWNTPAQGGNRRISVIGCGRWGTFLAWYLERSGQQVCLYGREGSARMDALVATRTNGVTTLPESIRLTHSLAEALERDTVVISVGAQG